MTFIEVWSKLFSTRGPKKSLQHPTKNRWSKLAPKKSRKTNTWHNQLQIENYLSKTFSKLPFCILFGHFSSFPRKSNWSAEKYYWIATVGTFHTKGRTKIFLVNFFIFFGQNSVLKGPERLLTKNFIKIRTSKI